MVLSLFVKCADGAGNDTLAAVYAGRIVKAAVEGAGDSGFDSAVGCADSADLLNIVTGGNTAAAMNALGIVADDRGRKIIDLGFALYSVEGIAVHAVFVTKRRKLAFTRADAGSTFTVVVGKQQLEVDLSALADLGGVGFNLHTLANRHNTGGSKRSCSLYFHKAEAAGADLLNIFKIAKGGNIDVCFLCGFEDGRPFRYRYRNARLW